MKNKILVCLALSFSSSVFAGSEMMSSLFNQDTSAAEVTTQEAPTFMTDSSNDMAEDIRFIDSPATSSSVKQKEDVPELNLMNFTTGNRETFQPLELSEEKAREFVPPIEKSQMTFNEFIDTGKEPYIALMMTYMFLESELEGSNTLPE